MFSKRLKTYRVKRGLTQEGLAELVNTTKGTISNYENGHSTPSNEMLIDIANKLNVTTDYLLGRSEDPRWTEQDQREDYKTLKEILNLIDSLPEERKKRVEQRLLDFTKGAVEVSKDL